MKFSSILNSLIYDYRRLKQVFIKSITLVFALLIFTINPDISYAEESLYVRGEVVEEEVVSRSPFLSRYTLKLPDENEITFLAPIGRTDNFVVSTNDILPPCSGELIEVRLLKKGNDYYLDLDEKPKISFNSPNERKLFATDISLATSTYQLQICPDYKLPRSTMPAGFYYFSLNSPYDNTLVQNAIRNASSTWNEVRYSFLDFFYSGMISGRTAMMGDRINSVGWAYLDTRELAITQFMYDTETLEIKEFDVYVNRTKSFGLLGENNKYDFQSVVLHELGHGAGLCHSNDQDSVMYPFISMGEIKRSLSSVDEMLIGQKYPAGMMTGRILNFKGNPVYYPGYPAYIKVSDTQSQITRIGITRSDGTFEVDSVPEGYATIFFEAYNYSLFSSEPVISSWYLNRLSPDEADWVRAQYMVDTNLKNIFLLEEIVIRINGRNRYHTAELAARRFFPESAVIVIASGLNFPDALVASSLGGVLKAPVLLVTKSSIPAESVSYIQSARPDKAYIIGGTGVISEDIKIQLKNLGVKDIIRLGGIDRFETSVKVAEKVVEIAGSEPDNLFICNGLNFPDALSISALSYFSKNPVLLTSKDKLPSSVKSFISRHYSSEKIVIGGEGVVSRGIYYEISASGRWAGKDRYETCAAIATNSILRGLAVGSAAIAVGDNFPDGLVAGFFAGNEKIPVLLTKKFEMPSPVNSFLIRHKDSIQSAYIAGGLGVVDYSLQNQVRNLIQ